LITPSRTRNATALAVAGVAAKPEWKLDGVNLLPFLEGKDKAAPHAALYWRFGEQLAIRMGDWKLVRAHLTLDRVFEDIAKQPMLLNLAEDASEKNDLAKARPEKVKELTEAWRRWNEGLRPATWPHPPCRRCRSKRPDG
jgi:arylsulfatase A-like enzyme